MPWGYAANDSIPQLLARRTREGRPERGGPERGEPALGELERRLHGPESGDGSD